MVFLDPTFGNNGKVITAFGTADDLALRLALQPDGKIVVVGVAGDSSFNSDFAVARYNSNGTLDTSFDGDGKVTDDIDGDEDSANTVALQPDGKIVVAGQAVDDFFGDADFAITRYNSNGSIDTGFDVDGLVTQDFDFNFDEATGAVIQPDGRIIVAGTARISGSGFSDDDFAVVRLNSNGSLDSSFGSNGTVETDFGPGDDSVTKALLQSDGKLLVVGAAENAFGDEDFAIARYDANGDLDTSFGLDGRLTTDFGSGNDGVIDAVLQTDGKILAVGKATVNGNADFGIARYNVNGTLDTNFGNGGKVTTDFGFGGDNAAAVMLQPNGKIIVVGTVSGSSVSQVGIARYTSDGRLDSSFGNGGKLISDLPNGAIAGGAVLQDGKLLVAGGTFNGSNEDFLLLRYVLNQSPTEITLSNSKVNENAAPNSTIGTLTTTDADPSDPQTYTLVTGTGSTDNTAFTIEGNLLKAKQSFDFEAKNTYSIRVKTTDDYGASFEKQLTITVNDLAEPTTGTTGNDPLTGNELDNTILGLAGNDLLLGQGGNDTLDGGEGNDRISGGGGFDVLTGSAGNDRFVFDSGARFQKGVLGIDQITDFQKGIDKIELDRTTFTRLKKVSFASVRTVAQAKRSKTLIAYVRPTGTLYYNENKGKAGFGAGGAFADLANGLALGKADISIVS